MWNCMQKVSAYNRDCIPKIGNCWTDVVNYASGPYSKYYSAGVSPCLHTIAKNCTRKDGDNIAKRLYEKADGIVRLNNGKKTFRKIQLDTCRCDMLAMVCNL